MEPVLIVGAGMAGLAAAIDLAAAGHPVTLVEKCFGPGGKMAEATVAGRAIDCGPTVLTMAGVFEALFADAGASLADHVRLTPAAILARHHWSDGATLDLFADEACTTDAIGAFAGARDAQSYRDFAAVTLAAEVAQAYFSLRLDQTQIAVVSDEIAREQRALSISGDIARAGLVPQSDVTRQRGTLTSLQARLEPLKADVRVRLHALAILLGAAPEALGPELTATPAVPLALPAVPAGLPSDLLRRRPDVRAAERNLAAATADIGVAVADLYPKFQLTGLGELLSTSLGNLFSKDSLQATAMGGINFPLLDWGRRRATVAIRKEQAEEAYTRYKATVLGALRDVEDPLARIDAERRRNATLRRAVNDQQSTARSIEARYRTGFVAQDQLLNAQVNVLSAREQLVASDMQLREDTAALFKAIGGGWDEASPAKP